MPDLKKTTASKFTNNTQVLECRYLDLIDYSSAYQMQLELHESVKKNPEASYLLGLEHPAVMTLGHRARAEDEILNQTVAMPVVRSTRGGLATIHSEGQLVIYPIVNLRERKLGVRHFVDMLLHSTQEALNHYGICTEIDSERVGLYSSSGKIAFCGLQIKNGISLHGLSLNMTNDLALFDQIIACGVQKQKMDRTENYKAIEKVAYFETWAQIFKSKLNY